MPFLLLESDPTGWSVLPGKTTIGVNASGQLVLKQSDGTTTVIASSNPGYDAQTSASGTITISPVLGTHTEIINVQGTARSVPVVIAIPTYPITGQICRVQFKLPIAGLALDIRNASGGGTQLDTYTSNGSTVTAYWEFYYDGTQWQKLVVVIPAY